MDDANPFGILDWDFGGELDTMNTERWTNMGGPPDKWVKFPVAFKTSDEVLENLNLLAAQRYDTVAVEVECSDGQFVFLGGYKK